MRRSCAVWRLTGRTAGPNDLARRRGAHRHPFGGRRRRCVARFAIERVELERRPVGAEGDHVAVLERRVGGDALAVQERAVAAAQVLKDEALGFADDGGVARGDVEVTLGIEPHVGEGMAAEPDVRLPEGLDLPGAGPREKLELGFHGLRVKYQSTAASTASAASTTVNRRPRASRVSLFGTGGRLPL